jgi:hypothetical protein
LRADDEPPELIQARAVFQKEAEFTMRPLRDRYLSRLDMMKRTLGARGDARGAVAVQDEMDRLKASGGDQSPVARFAGVWLLDYGGGTSRRYAIKPDGSVSWEATNGADTEPRRFGKIVLKDFQFLLEGGDGYVERFTMVGKTLYSEQFSLQSFPKGLPAFRGTGTLVSSGK